VYYRGEFFGACQSLRAFQPVLSRSGQDCPYHRGKSVAEVVRRITEWVEAQPPQPWNWRQVALFRLAARIVRPFIPTPALDAVRRWRRRHAPLEHRPAIAGIIGASGFETGGFEPREFEPAEFEPSRFEPAEFESERKAA